MSRLLCPEVVLRFFTQAFDAIEMAAEEFREMSKPLSYHARDPNSHRKSYEIRTCEF
jgi:hypothetical protein